MVKRELINGRLATVNYLTLDLEPANPQDAEIIKVLFDDGETMFAYPSDVKSDIGGNQ